MNLNLSAISLSCCVWLVACTGEQATDTAKGADTARDTGTDTNTDTNTNTDTGTNTDTDTTGVRLTVGLNEFATGAPVAGATVSYGSQTVTTDADGVAAIQATAQQNLVLSVAADGYFATDLHMYASSSNYAYFALLPSEATAAALSGALGLTLDPAKAIVAIGVTNFDPDGVEPGSYVEGATVDLDVPYDAAVVPDASSPLGIALGNTTLVGSNSTVVFINVESGTVTPTLTVPGGLTCAYGHPNFEAAPNHYVGSSYYCQ